jgi:hypothetical protein
MKGLPSNIDLAPFSDAELIQLCFGVAQVQFHFSNQASVNVESAIVVGGPSGEQRVEDYGQVAPLLTSLLGTRLLGAVRKEDGGVLLRFEGDRDIRVLNDSTQFESFQIRIGGLTYVG